MDKVKKSITVYVPGNVCNMRCSYCYVSECLYLEHREYAKFDYSVEHMVKAFKPERIGGIAYITVIGDGETLIPDEVIPFVKGLLELGHVVEVVTNNTLNNRIDELLRDTEGIERLIVKCSLHWSELKRLNKIEDYFTNMKKVIAAGASTYPFLVICEEYMPYLDEIIEYCEKELGGLPQCTPCVVASSQDEFFQTGHVVTSPECTEEFTQMIHKKINSELFTEAVKFLSINPKEVFCYAGQWSFAVKMDSGRMLKCHNVDMYQNFFQNIEKPIQLEPVGCECGISSCSLQYQFYGFGCIPEVSDTKTYSKMMYRENMMNETVRSLLDVKFYEQESILSPEEERKFLMHRIAVKDKEMEKEENAFREEQEKNVKLGEQVLLAGERMKDILKTEAALVNEIYAVISAPESDYAQLRKIKYLHLKALYDLCAKQEKGEGTFNEMYSMIADRLLRLEETGISTFAIENITIDEVLNFPVTTFWVEQRFSDEVGALLEQDKKKELIAVCLKSFRTLMENRV